VVKAMKADGLEVSILVLNSLINAFGEDRRVVEAFSVLQFMKENVSGVFVIVCYFDLFRILIVLVFCLIMLSSAIHLMKVCYVL
jgi:pentatricopeptide repeat protein